MRLFVAVNPGRPFREALASGLDSCRKQLPLAWVRPENWHLTLKFLGECPESSVESLLAALACEARLQVPFTVIPGGVSAFPNMRAPRVLFLQMSSDGALENLATGIRRRLRPLAVADDKPFRAHLTLARIKQRLSPQHLQLLADLDPGVPDAFRVESFSLVRSRLLNRGAVYDELASFSLESGR